MKIKPNPERLETLRELARWPQGTAALNAELLTKARLMALSIHGLAAMDGADAFGSTVYRITDAGRAQLP